MELWPHQQQGLEELAQLISQGARRICLTSPTGGGKSFLMANRIMQSGSSTTIYVHRKLLLEQISRRMEEFGIDHGRRASGHKPALLRPHQISMVQTEHSRAIKNRSNKIHAAGEVFVDEAHNNKQQQAVELFDAHKQANSDVAFIGFTATPLGIGHLYDHLVTAGTNSQLRACGAHVPAYHYSPDEPSSSLVGKVKVGEGECGIPVENRDKYVHQVFGRVRDNLLTLNPELKPTMMFAPGVKESIWLCQQLHKAGITAAHIDGQDAWVNGETVTKNQAVVDSILEDSEKGKIKVISNRFVLREGIDATWISHGILATVFGSLTSYLQAGGRIIRSHPTLEKVTIQDHGGNAWRHGSLNEDRVWSLGDDDMIVQNERIRKIREGALPEPITCPKCSGNRMSGPTCPFCGFRYDLKKRMVMQVDGTLKLQSNKAFQQRKSLPDDVKVRRDWTNRVRAIRNSKKTHVKNMTFAQLDAAFARDHNWKYAPRGIPGTPTTHRDWYKRIVDVPQERLVK